MSKAITSSANITAPEPALDRLVAEAIEVLGVRDNIAAAADTIFAQIEWWDSFATGSSEEDAIFLASTLAVANAVIHYRTSHHQLGQARAWAREHFPEQKDPTTALATLTLIYMIEEGWKRYRNIAEKKTVWERIHGRVATVIDEARTIAA